VHLAHLQLSQGTDSYRNKEKLAYNQWLGEIGSFVQEWLPA